MLSASREIAPDPLELSERQERVPELEAEIDGLLDRRAGLGQMPESAASACSKQLTRLAERRARHRLAPAWRQ